MSHRQCSGYIYKHPFRNLTVYKPLAETLTFQSYSLLSDTLILVYSKWSNYGSKTTKTELLVELNSTS